MPIKIPNDLPSYDYLKDKWVFVMDHKRAITQDIRALRIWILNLMPKKEDTENQLLRMIWSSPLQIEAFFIKTSTYKPKNTKESHLKKFYKTFDEAIKIWLDGLIITWAPVEKMEFEDVKYLEELKYIMNTAKEKITSTLFLCWAAQAWLYHFYDIKKYEESKKIFWIFKHTHTNKNLNLLRWLDDEFYVPHSRHTWIKKEDIKKHKDLQILSESKEAWVYMIASKDAKFVFITWHPEYDRDTLAKEYFRDLEKWENIQIPVNYFPWNDPKNTPKLIWRANAEMFYRNWINYVYQTTPYIL